MGRPASTKKCPLCGLPGLKRNGTTSSGKVRWRCTKCGASNTRRRGDQAQLSQFAQFHQWITSHDSQSRMDGTQTGRSFRQEIRWCWDVPVPPALVTGEIHDQVFIDGTYLAYGWCLLVARAANGTVVAWQWCRTENSPAYGQLLARIAEPLVVTTDGAGGALKAISEHWPGAKVQRCLLHVYRNNVRDLTRHPKTMAGKILLGLSRQLLKITNEEQAAHWASLLAQFHSQYDSYLKQRTYGRDNPREALSRGKRLTGWWYTHERDRRVYNRLNRLYQSGQLFTYLTAAPRRLERTTNPVESVNNQVKNVIKDHPGLSEDHLLAGIEWVLYSYTERPKAPREILKKWRLEGKPTRRIIPTKTPAPKPRIGPALYDNHASPEEGLWGRKGWAGRSH